jgi:NADPH:quinone reductase
MFSWFEAGKLSPLVSHKIPLEQAKDALYAIIQREVVGKCVVTTGRS